MEFLNDCPLEGKKRQPVCWVVGFSLVQASTGIGYYIFGTVLSSLIEYSSESLQVIKGLLTPTVQLNGSPLFACIFT